MTGKPSDSRFAKTGRFFSILRQFPGRFRIAPAVVLLLLVLPFSAAAQRGAGISYLADDTAALTIESVSSAEKAGDFKGYIPSFMAFSQLPDTFNGAIWLRITLDASFEKPVTALRIDLGSSLPGVTRLFVPRANGGFTVLENPPHLGMFTLPENVPFPDVLYARIDGTPGLWFKPFLGPAEEAPRALPVHFLLAGLFGAAMLLLLFRYVRKAEEWRLWAAITAGCGIVTAILPPVPIAGAAYTPLMATALLIPGLILVLYAHTTRHLFNSPTAIPGYDKILVGLYLAGGVIALLPLVPGFLWTSRYLPFAGALLVALLPLCMIALALSLRGCSAYFCACLLPVFGVAASAWELTATGAPMLAGTGGLWGFGLAVLVLAFIPPARATAEETAEDDVFDSLCRSSPLTLRDAGPFEPEPPREPGEPARPVEPVFTETAPDSPEGPTDETAQREESPDEGPLADEYPSLSLFDGETRITEPSPATEIQAADNAASAALPIPESALSPRPALASSIEEGIPLETASPAGAEPASRPQTLPERNFSAAPDAPPAPIVPATPEASSPPVLTLTDTEPEETAGASALSWSVEKHVPREDNEPSEQEEPDPAPAMERRKSRRILFNLPLLIKNAYDTLAPLAEGKNCSMTWYIAPQTGRLFEGDAELLESALRRILRDMVESVEQGNVRLTVRRLPDSAEAGHLVFTIAGWDAKQVTAHERNIAGHAEAWALAEKTGGIFSVEHSPSGTTVIFSAMFTAMDTPRPAEAEASGAVPCPANEAGRIAVPGRENSVVASVFTDHPDIAPPVESEENLTVRSVIADIPVGVDADGLAEERETERSPYRLIIADIAVSSRARAAGQFADSPYSVLECASPADAFALYRRHPSALVIMNADMPEVDILEAINDIHADDAEHGRTPAFSVALAGYPAQANRLAQAGVTRTVLKKQMEEELLPTVEELLPPPGPRQPQAAPAKASAPEIRLGNALDDVPPVPATFAPGEPVTGLSAPSELPPSILSPVAGDASAMPENGPAAHATEPEKTPPARLEVPAGPVVPGAGYSGPGLGLLDMIITDEEAEVAPESDGARDAEPVVARPPVKPVPSVTVRVKPSPAKIPAPVLEPETVEPGAASAEESPIPATPSPAAGHAPISVPLPGEDDSVFKDMLPLIPGLIVELNDAMNDALRGKEEKSPLLVQEAAERVAGKAGSFGLTRLERMARCVERAAAADDVEPMECVLADLEAWVARYKDALQKLHREAQW